MTMPLFTQLALFSYGLKITKVNLVITVTEDGRH
jgi:hypothetical protein